MHTLYAYYASIVNNSTDALVTAIPDETVNVVDSRYQFQQQRRLLRAFAGVPNGTAVRIDAPSFSGFVRPVISPIDADTTLGGNLPPVMDFGDRALTIAAKENVGPLVTRAGAGAADCAVLLWASPAPRAAPSGPCYTVRGTSANTGAAGGWRLSTLTLDQALPAGRYAVIGLTIFGPNVLAGRLVFQGQVERPGVMANVDQTSWVYPSLRFGSMGLFGEFDNTAVPQLQLLSYGAMTTQVITMDLVPISRV